MGVVEFKNISVFDQKYRVIWCSENKELKKVLIDNDFLTGKYLNEIQKQMDGFELSVIYSENDELILEFYKQKI